MPQLPRGRARGSPTLLAIARCELLALRASPPTEPGLRHGFPPVVAPSVY